MTDMAKSIAAAQGWLNQMHTRLEYLRRTGLSR